MTMGEIQAVLESPNKAGIFLTVIAAIVAVQFIVKLIDWFRDRYGFETKNSRREKEQTEAVNTLKAEVTQIKKDQSEIINAVSCLTDTVNEMKKISDKNEAARLKDRISQGYRYFSERGEWTSMDKESMKDLIDAYSQFSQNSFVHSVVEIEMEKWKVIDD